MNLLIILILTRKPITMEKIYTYRKIRVHHLQQKLLSLLVLMTLLLPTHFLRAQKAIDSLNYATDGSVSATVIQGDFLYFGGDFNFVGERTGSVAFFKNGASQPDKNKPLFGSLTDLMTKESVLSAYEDASGGWFVGGTFQKVDDQTHKLLAHILSDNTVDPNLNIRWKSTGKVSVLKGDGTYLYVGGEFVALDDQEVEHKNVFRLNLASLKIDPAWNPALVNSTKVDHIVLGGDLVFLSGWIGAVEGIQQDAMVTVDAATGARVQFPSSSQISDLQLMGDTLLLAQPDMYWSSYSDGYGYLAKGTALLTETSDIPENASVKANFYAAISDGNGGWYAAGNYPDHGGYGVFHLDQNLVPVSAFSQTQIRNFNKNTCLLLDGNNLYVAANMGGSSALDDGNGNKIAYLFKLDATSGALDVNFAPNPDNEVRTLLLDNGVFYIGGDFGNIGTDARTGLAALDPSSGALKTWNPELNASNYNSGYTGGDLYISDLKMISDTLYAAGEFMIASESLPDAQRGIYALARFDRNTGNVDTSFHISSHYQDHAVVTGLEFSNNKFYVAGTFNLNTVTPAKNVGMVNLKNGEVKPLNADLSFTSVSSSVDPRIRAYNGNLYVVGVNTEQVSTGQSRAYLVSLKEQDYTLNTWKPQPNNLVYVLAFNPDHFLVSGLFDFLDHYRNNLAGINIKTKEYVQFPNVAVNAIASNDRYIFLGGDFTSYGDSVVNGLARLNRHDLSLTRFDHQILNANKAASIGNLALGIEGLYVAGAYYDMFTTVAGVDRQNICLLDPETGLLKEWNPPPVNGKIYQVFAFGSDVAVSGAFGLMPAWTRYSLARVNLTTGKVDDWDPVLTGYYPKVYAMAFSGDTLFIGGTGISKVNAETAGNLCALDPASGSVYAGFVPPDLNGNVSSLAVCGGFVYAGGSFTKANAVSHNYVAKFKTAGGDLETWDPQLSSWNVQTLLATDTAVFIGGFNLQVTGNDQKGGLLKVKPGDGSLMKAYPSAGIYSLAMNQSGKLAAGAYRAKGLLILDESSDTLVAANMQQEFSGGVNAVRAIGNLFLAAGNRLKEFGSYTTKPGFLVYDPMLDSVTTCFSVPLVDGSISTFAASQKNLVMAGDFEGMNVMKKNTDLSFMTLPDLHLQPGVTSWSPQTANNMDPFAVSIYGSGFSESSQVSLMSGSVTHSPDSLTVKDHKIIAYFNGVNFTPGYWDLKVQIDAENTQQFSKALTIQEGQYTDVWAKWIGPNRVLVGKPVSNYISFGNRGTRDAYGMVLYLAVGDKQSVLFPKNITHQQVNFEVNWDTVSNYVNVDYFLGEPFKGKVYTMFIPYLPANYEDAMKIKITSEESHEIRVAISKPIYANYQALFETLKSGNGMAYDFFSCVYSVASMAADLTPGISCAKAAFDNSVLMAVDKYQNNESIQIEDIAYSIGMTALSCVPGEAQISKAYAIAKGMASMYAGGADASGAMSACGNFAGDAAKALYDIMAYTSHDPNAKFGPSGRGLSRFVNSGQDFHYMITYENDSAATAPAQRVIITDTLDKNVFKIATFKALGFGFGDTTYFYKNTDGDTVMIDLRPKKQALVRVFYHLDQNTGILTWTFQTLDPNTFELVEDVDAGFLPPNKTAPEGEGNVLYSIAPADNLSDSTEVHNAAHIVFDWNASIPTNSWDNRTDNTAPESNVKSLASVTMSKDFQVHWSGKDNASGIFSYTVYVAENDDNYYVWLPETHDTVATFSGVGGNTYKFYSVATDSAGNLELEPAVYDAITRVSGTGIDTFGTGDQMEFRVYPNPARSIVNVSYYLPKAGRVRMDILNLCGNLVMQPLDKRTPAGKNEVRLDLTKLPAGYYFVRILTPSGIQTRKMIVQ